MRAVGDAAVICDLRDEPQFFDIVAERIWTAFWQASGEPPAYIAGLLRESLGEAPIPTALVAHAGDAFLGTVSLIACDVDERPQLTPWVAALWVEPAARERGIGAELVEEAARRGFALGHRRLFLSASARMAPYYEKRGWRLHERGVPTPDLTILSRDADGQPPA